MMHRLLFYVICTLYLFALSNSFTSVLIACSIALIGAALLNRFTVISIYSLIHIPLLAIYTLHMTITSAVLIFAVGVLFTYYQRVTEVTLKRMQHTKLELDTHIQQFNDTFQVVRKERHDYLKHVSAIAYMLEQHEHMQAKTYMRKILAQYEETNLSIQGENAAVAAVLHTNYQRAKENGLTIHYQLDFPVSSLPFSTTETVELIGNLLENAIEAAIEWQATKQTRAQITLALVKKSGLLILTCENNTLPIPAQIADNLYTATIGSNKGEQRGLGTQIVRDIIQRHNGYFDFTTEQDYFSFVCKVPHIIKQVDLANASSK